MAKRLSDEISNGIVVGHIANAGGIDPKTIRKTVEDMVAKREKIASASGAIGQAYDEAEDRGMNRAALKMLERFFKMSPEKRADIWGTFMPGMEALNLLPDADLIDHLNAKGTN